MKTGVISKTFASKIEALREALSSVKQDIIAAGKLLVEMLDENEDAFEILVAQRIASLQTLEALEKVGRGKLDPLLLTDPSPMAQRAISQNLPVSQQRQIMTQHIALVVKGRAGVYEVEQRTKDEISLAESFRAIRDGRLTTPEQQIAILQEHEAKAAIRDMRVQIDEAHGRVRFLQDSEFSYAQLIEIAEKIKPKAEDIQASITKRQVVK